MLYIRSIELFISYNWIFVPLNNIYQFPPLDPATTILPCIYEFDFFKVTNISESVQYLSLCLAYFIGSPMQSQMTGFPSF